MIRRDRLTSHLQKLLDDPPMRDYGPNGVQVEGREEIARVVTGVSASAALIEAAVAAGADAIIVHHGLFWNDVRDLRVMRGLKARLAPLLREDVSLYAYHLPLDRHPTLGNNAVLASTLGASIERWAFALEGVPIGCVARFAEPLPLDQVLTRVARATQREPLVVEGGPDLVSTIGICSGGAAKMIGEAARLGCEMYLTGEPTEFVTHVAREERIHFVAAGHHATERFGVQALGEHLATELGLNVRYIEIDNPV